MMCTKLDTKYFNINVYYYLRTIINAELEFYLFILYLNVKDDIRQQINKYIFIGFIYTCIFSRDQTQPQLKVKRQ